jgi:hypothetical protein
MHFARAVALVVIALALGRGAPASAGFDFEHTMKVGAGKKVTFTVSFTDANGDTIAQKAFQFSNGTANPITKTFKAEAPAGTQDREISASLTAVAAAAGAMLPHGQVGDLAAYFAANGFTGQPTTFDSPVVVADANHDGVWDEGDASVYSLMNDIRAYTPVANASLFPLDSTLATNSNGQVDGLPGITFYSDSSFAAPIANAQLLVVGFNSEAVPEPASLTLALAGAMSAIGYRVFSARRTRGAEALG